MASLESELRFKLAAMSSRHAFASLSIRAGRFLSLLKVMEQSCEVLMTGGGGGATTVTEVVVEAVWPLSSATLQVTVMVPGAAPTVLSVAVVLVPDTEPAVEL